jgi:hypothetical protein
MEVLAGAGRVADLYFAIQRMRVFPKQFKISLSY